MCSFLLLRVLKSCVWYNSTDPLKNLEKRDLSILYILLSVFSYTFGYGA